MKIIKKINNNVAIALDNNNREIVVFGKGIGFQTPPYELNDYSKIEQPFYNVDRRLYDLFSDLDEKVLLLTSRMVEKIKMSTTEKWSPNLTVILADHIQFAIERERSGMEITLPYLHEIEESEPRITSYALWIVKNVNHHFQVRLPKGEVGCIAMHLINARVSSPKTDQETLEEKRSRILKNSIRIIENYFDLHISRTDSSYFRFRQHINYFVQRKQANEELADQNYELFELMKAQYPDAYNCLVLINDYLYKEYGLNCSEDELLYLMIHLQRLIQKADPQSSPARHSED